MVVAVPRAMLGSLGRLVLPDTTQTVATSEHGLSGAEKVSKDHPDERLAICPLEVKRCIAW